MTSTNRNSGLRFLSGAIAILLPVSFIIALPWIKTMPNSAASMLAGIASIGTVVSAMLLAILKDGDMDEWNRAAARFASNWGWPAGGAIIVGLISLPPVREGIVALNRVISPGDAPDDTNIMLGFVMGFMALMLAQVICTLAFNAFWRARMSRPEA